MKKLEKISTELELSRKMMSGSVKVKISTYSKVPTHDKIKVEMGIPGTGVEFWIVGYSEKGKDHTTKIIELSNKLVEGLNKYIDEHPELGNEPKMSFEELEKLVNDRLGKYRKENRIVRKPTRGGRVKVAFQYYRPDYEPGEDGPDFPSMRVSKDGWYDEGLVWSIAEGSLETEIFKMKDKVLEEVDSIVKMAKEIERIDKERYGR